ncbi:unnamed protein product [Notodromas monacha]|uniref:Phosphatidylcholine 1-acylhydrolase n=1 Tax=Notodromas monacha TaxID=399045 RepID=A0A7R9GJR6_9CRUS|nr:unnamed protein product [Notodromas monacha]CAG0925259.1 unnamed protein product [Notodromas monacha]
MVCEEHQSDRLVEEVQNVWDKLAIPEQTVTLKATEQVDTDADEAWLIQANVQFCSSAYQAVEVSHPDAAPLMVLAAYLRNGFLHSAIREKGGAYGGGASYDGNACSFRFYSYRDPRLAETFNDFEASVQWLLNTEQKPHQLEEAILGLIAGMDKPGSPAGEAITACYALLHARTPAFRKQLRSRLLAVGLEDLQRVAVQYLLEQKPTKAVVAPMAKHKNEYPQSPNPTNTVDEDQNLKSMEAKFQLSLKTKAVENLFGDNGDVWLGYTQSSRWQLYNSDESRPFRETNYEPEASLVFRTNYELLGLNGRLLGLTFNHQSNGRSDPLSRSWNRVMLNVGFERDNFALMLRPWYRLDEDADDDNNPDIKDYVGRGKLRGHFQLFDGYGESLIDYNHRATYVGLGVSLMNWY